MRPQAHGLPCERRSPNSAQRTWPGTRGLQRQGVCGRRLQQDGGQHAAQAAHQQTEAGGAELLADPTWGQTFARAASAALAKAVITVDLATMSVSY